MTSILLLGQVIPWLLLPFTSGTAFACAAVAAGCGLLIRLIAAARFRQSWFGAMCHPLGVLTLLAIKWIGLIRHLSGKRTEWKGRALD